MNPKMSPTYQVYTAARRRNHLNQIDFWLQREDELITYTREMFYAIREELTNSGHCWLVDNAFFKGYVHSVDWAVIQAFRNWQCTSNQPELVIQQEFQLLPITDHMEKEMVSLYRTPDSRKNKSREFKNAASVQKANELNRQLEQARQEKATLDDNIERLRNEIEQLRLEKQQTQMLIQDRLNDAKTEAEGILREARERADGIRAELMQGIVAESLPETDAVQDDDGLLRDKVERETRRLETTVRTSLDAYRDEIHKMLIDFRTGLYKADYTSLCSEYQRLYLFATDTFDRRINSLCEELDNEDLSAQVQSTLHKVQGQLIRRVTAMEGNFKKLGLTVFYPQKGEEYNDVYHIADNVEDDGYLEATIRYCVCPGICTDQQVLCRAAVVVDTEENG